MDTPMVTLTVTIPRAEYERLTCLGARIQVLERMLDSHIYCDEEMLRTIFDLKTKEEEENDG